MSELRAWIRATGSCVPTRKLTNAELETLVDTSDEWIRTRTGIAERAVADPEDATSDLATRAAQNALAQAQLESDAIDLIMVATCTSDYPIPSTANLVQRNLGLSQPVPSLDLNAACSGFVYGLEIGGDLLASGRYQRILLIGAETLTRIVDYQDRETCVLFGDAAGAAILEPAPPERGLVASALYSDGEFWNMIHIPGGGTRRPVSPYVLTQREQFVRMNGRQTFRLAVQAMEQVAREALGRAGWKVADLRCVLVHQANQRIIDAVAERLEIPGAMLPSNIAGLGNTSAASIPVLLDECNRAGSLRAGDRVLAVAFGAGLTWGAAALIW